jgi:DNA-binding Xre family transcriptional regulator
MDIRARIEKILSDRPDLTPRSLSLKAGLSDSMMHKFLTGQTRSMTVENLEKVASVLSVSAQWLIFGDTANLPDSKLFYIWDHIPDEKRDQALRVLETFADDDNGLAA